MLAYFKPESQTQNAEGQYYCKPAKSSEHHVDFYSNEK